MKRRSFQSVLGQAADKSVVGEPLEFWWKDDARIIRRALVIASGDAKARRQLEDGLKRRRGAPKKHPLWLRMMIIDAVEYVREKAPTLAWDQVYSRALRRLPEGLKEDQVRGIYTRRENSTRK